MDRPADDPGEDETMIINMGPQHPSTHGVLRLMLELDGETVLRTKPVIGYLHTGMEKTGEDLTYLQGPHQRHPHGLRVAALQRAGVLPGRREAARHRRRHPGAGRRGSACCMCELNRITSHLLFLATNGMDIGAVSMMLYGWREREEGLRFLEKVTGLRMNHNYIRVGGVAADLPRRLARRRRCASSTPSRPASTSTTS